MATKKKPSAKQLAARAKFAAMARARAKAAKGKKRPVVKKVTAKKTTTNKINAIYYYGEGKKVYSTDLKIGAKYEWIAGAGYQEVTYIGKASQHPNRRCGTRLGVGGYIFQFDDGSCTNISAGAVVQNIRTIPAKKVTGTKSRKTPATTSRHVDTKSHNVKINVLSGMPKSSNKMYVRIDDLGYIYTDAGILKNYLKENANKWVEVDTSYLFDNQYNTIDGYRIYDTMINAIKNDARKGNKQFENNNRCCFLIWKGIKPNVLPFNDSTDKIAKKTKITWKNPTYQIGTYEFESNFLKHYRLQNARQRIKFLYWDKTYFLTDGIGYRATKSLTGGWPISYTIPDNVKNKVNQILNTL